MSASGDFTVLRGNAGGAILASLLAIEIADDAARSDIECCAKQQQLPGNGGRWCYSLTETVQLRDTIAAEQRHNAQFAHNLQEAMEWLRITQRAAKYISGRGNVFAWRMVDVEGMPGWVRFIDKEGRPVDPGVKA